MSATDVAQGSQTRATVWGWLQSRALQPMPEGAVLVHAPSHTFQAPGGGEVQLARTAWHLDSMGLPVHPFRPWTDRIERARLLHLFGMSREGLELARIANARGVPVVLSPICWIEPRAIAQLACGAAGQVRGLAGWGARRLMPWLPTWRGELLNLADAILPNSRAEADQLVRLFRVDARKISVVPNGVEPWFEKADPEPFQTLVGTEPFVLFVGRIEPRKNPLGLIQAMKGGPHRLVVVGDPPPGSEAYAAACRREGDGFTQWIGRLDADDPRLASAYAAARVLALPSWFETPGLVALEAALAGTPIVVTRYGCTREYFQEWADYVDPGSARSIRAGLDHAWGRTGPTELVEIVQERYLWSRVAQRTAEVYDQIAC